MEGFEAGRRIWHDLHFVKVGSGCGAENGLYKLGDQGRDLPPPRRDTVTGITVEAKGKERRRER